MKSPRRLPVLACLLAAVAVTGCGDKDDKATDTAAADTQTAPAAPAATNSRPSRAERPAGGQAAIAASATAVPVAPPVALNKGLRWNGTSSDEGVGITLYDGNDAAVMTLSCFRNPPRFGVVASQLAVMAGSSSVTLGVDNQAFNFSLPDTADGFGPGVHGRGDIPAQLLTALDNDSMGPREIRINYAGQQLGPYLPPTVEQLISFVTECRGIASTGQPDNE